ncbi:hypothetical protein Hanom_Chr11g00976261 [Helianthus anomalus]
MYRLGKEMVFLVTQVRYSLFPLFSVTSRRRANTDGARSSWMGGEVLPIIPLSCLRSGGGWVSAHLGEPRGRRRSRSRPWPQRPISWWLSHRSLSFKKKVCLFLPVNFL